MNETLIITAIILSGLALMIGLAVGKTRNETRRQLKLLKDEMETVMLNAQLQPHKEEIFRNRMIALDTNKKVLVYVKLVNNIPKYDLINLEQVSTCKVAELGIKLSDTSTKGKTTTEQHITSTVLQLRRGNDVVFDVVFYCEIQDGAMERMALTNKATEWCELLNKLMRTPVLA